MTVETQKQKRIIQPFVDLTWLLNQKQKRIIHFVTTTTIDHSVDLTWLLKHKNKRELYTLWSLQPLSRSNMTVETQN